MRYRNRCRVMYTHIRYSEGIAVYLSLSTYICLPIAVYLSLSTYRVHTALLVTSYWSIRANSIVLYTTHVLCVFILGYDIIYHIYIYIYIYIHIYIYIYIYIYILSTEMYVKTDIYVTIVHLVQVHYYFTATFN